MEKWGFQGADLDWEYPASDVRGGRPEDTANLVLLVKEMRAAFGSKYGISSILAPDYWYLRGMDPKAMVSNTLPFGNLSTPQLLWATHPLVLPTRRVAGMAADRLASDRPTGKLEKCVTHLTTITMKWNMDTVIQITYQPSIHGMHFDANLL